MQFMKTAFEVERLAQIRGLDPVNLLRADRCQIENSFVCACTQNAWKSTCEWRNYEKRFLLTTTTKTTKTIPWCRGWTARHTWPCHGYSARNGTRRRLLAALTRVQLQLSSSRDQRHWSRLKRSKYTCKQPSPCMINCSVPAAHDLIDILAIILPSTTNTTFGPCSITILLFFFRLGPSKPGLQAKLWTFLSPNKQCKSTEDIHLCIFTTSWTDNDVSNSDRDPGNFTTTLIKQLAEDMYLWASNKLEFYPKFQNFHKTVIGNEFSAEHHISFHDDKFETLNTIVMLYNNAYGPTRARHSTQHMRPPCHAEFGTVSRICPRSFPKSISSSLINNLPNSKILWKSAPTTFQLFC